MSDQEGGWAPLAALPDTAAGSPPGPARQLACEGETFQLRGDGRGGTHYAWLTGPNAGYGFTVNPTADDDEQHRASIREFLSMIDQRTGYLADD